MAKLFVASLTIGTGGSAGDFAPSLSLEVCSVAHSGALCSCS
ncbi:MAG: hypothetical protein ABJA82_09965 [Myxococcales bacterium]